MCVRKTVVLEVTLQNSRKIHFFTKACSKNVVIFQQDVSKINCLLVQLSKGQDILSRSSHICNPQFFSWVKCMQMVDYDFYFWIFYSVCHLSTCMIGSFNDRWRMTPTPTKYLCFATLFFLWCAPSIVCCMMDVNRRMNVEPKF